MSAAAICPNCGASVTDRFCGRCGQDQQRQLLSLRAMVAELADDHLSINGTLPRTLAALFARPGHLTREYRLSRVARYVRPFRLFLVSVVLLFLAFALAGGARAATAWLLVQANVPVHVPPTEVDETGQQIWQNVTLGYEIDAAPAWIRPAVLRMKEQEQRLNRLPPREAFRLIMAASIDAAARMVLLMVPLFAGLLKLVHLFRRRLYAEHFVFALHFHAAAFLALIPAFVLALVVGHWAPLLVAAIYATLYLPVALWRGYGQPWWLAVIKAVILWTIYPVVLSVALALTLWLGIMLA